MHGMNIFLLYLAVFHVSEFSLPLRSQYLHVHLTCIIAIFVSMNNRQKCKFKKLWVSEFDIYDVHVVLSNTISIIVS